MNRRAGWVGGLALALVVTAIATGVGAAVGANAAASPTNAQSDGELVRTTALSLTPERAGEVGVVASYEIPDAVTELTVTPPSSAESVTADGFRETAEGYEWTGESDPEIRFDFPTNRTLSGEARAQRAGGDLAFADTGPWAITRIPSFSTSASGVSSFHRETVIDGPGVVGDSIAYLGPSERHTRRADDQNISLVVPEAASLAEDPEAILDALAAGSSNLRVGDVDERVVMIAAPTNAPWGPYGVQSGANAAWVRADQRLDSAGNTWLHEYVHTRQSFRTTDETRWLTEASAQYYAALLALEDGLIGFDAFQRQLARGDDERYDSVVLANQTTWTDNAQYLKGSLVTGELDRRIRLATDGAGTFAGVFSRVNTRTSADERLTEAAFLAAVEDAEPSAVNAARRYTETDARPAMWDRPEHRRAFEGTAPRFDYVLADPEPFAITGPYRNETTASLPELVVGETLAVSVRVRNTGTATGEYDATLRAGERTLTSETGELAPGERANVTLRHAFDRTGGPLRVGRTALGANVSEPLEPGVADLRLGGRTSDGVAIDWDATNDGDRPANGTIVATVNGDSADERAVALGPGERRAYRSVFDLAPGDYRIEIGGESLAVTVAEATTAGPERTGGAPDSPTTESPGAGVGPVAAVLALLSLAALRRHGR